MIVRLTCLSEGKCHWQDSHKLRVGNIVSIKKLVMHRQGQKRLFSMSKVQYKLPIFLNINGKKVCHLVDYHLAIQFRKEGSSEQLLKELVQKAA